MEIPYDNRRILFKRDPVSRGYRTVETDRTFTYDDAGKLLSVTETESGCGTCVYTYEYDLMGNRTAAVKTNEIGHKYRGEKLEMVIYFVRAYKYRMKVYKCLKRYYIGITL